MIVRCNSFATQMMHNIFQIKQNHKRINKMKDMDNKNVEKMSDEELADINGGQGEFEVIWGLFKKGIAEVPKVLFSTGDARVCPKCQRTDCVDVRCNFRRILGAKKYHCNNCDYSFDR